MILKNDIVLTSHLVSGEHGRFVCKGGFWTIEDKAAYKDCGSTNGLIYNNASIISRTVGDGDFIRIDDGVETIAEGVLFVFSSADSDNKWHSAPLAGKQKLSIGRGESCDIILPMFPFPKFMQKSFVKATDGILWTTGSTNGVIVNNKRISGKANSMKKMSLLSLTPS